MEVCAPFNVSFKYLLNIAISNCLLNDFFFFFGHPFRYKNPIDIPLGNAKQKIKSLKARVCTGNQFKD